MCAEKIYVPLKGRPPAKNRRVLFLLSAVFLMFLCILCIMPAAAAASWMGSGDSGNPYEIATAADLVQLAAEVNNGNNYSGMYFRVTGDIDLAGSGSWVPIGNGSTPFAGHFDGGGKAIANLFIDSSEMDQGLFGRTDPGSSVEYVALTNASVRGGDYTGSLVGFAEGSVANCYAVSDVSGGHTVGGLIGATQGSSVSSCYAAGNVSGSGGRVGGLIGLVTSSPVENCVALNSNLTSGESGFGRVIGYAAGTKSSTPNNYAWNNMIVSKPLSNDKYVLGTNVSSAEIWADVTFYRDTLGWDIDDEASLWQIIRFDDGAAYPLPYFRTQTVLPDRTAVAGLMPEAVLSDVTLEASDGEPQMQTVSIQTGDTSFSGTVTVPARDMFLFTGWYNDSGVRVADNTSALVPGVYGYTSAEGKWMNRDSSVILSANWTQRFTVTFDPNNATSPVSWDVIVSDGDMVEEPDTPVYPGHTLNGWNTAEGTPWNFAADTVTDDITLTASWTVNETAVTFLNYTGDADGTVTLTFGETVPPVSVPAREGFTFGGYFADSNQTGQQIFDATGEPVNVTGYITEEKTWTNATSSLSLSANWTANETAVTFLNYAGDADGAVTLIFGETVPPVSVPVRAGFTFGGYFADSNLTGTQIFNATGESVSVTGYITEEKTWANATAAVSLHAGWTVNRAVIFNPNNATSPVSWSVSVSDGDMVEEPDTPVYPGHTLNGWNTTDGTPWNFATDTVTNDITLTANWTANQTAVTFLNYTDGTDGSVTLTFGQAVAPVSVPVRAGFTFGGYFADSNLTGTQIFDAAGEPVSVTGYITEEKTWVNTTSTVSLSANWTVNETAITLLNYTGGTDGTVTLTFGETVPPVSVPARAGFIFNGYFADNNQTGRQVFNATGEPVRNNSYITPDPNYISSDGKWPHTTAAVSLFAGWTAAWQGEGTENDPYQIKTAADLANLAINVQNGIVYEGEYFRLMNNINLSDYDNWVPIGSRNGKLFCGTLDGGGKTISNLRITNYYGYSGLFGAIDTMGSASHLTLENISVQSRGKRASGLVGELRGTIANCHVTGNVSGTQDAGGLIGYVQSPGSVTNCSMVGNVSGERYVGGLIGQAYGIMVTNCYTSGNVSGGGNGKWGSTGGLIGQAYGTMVTNCYTASNVCGDTTGTGGLIGSCSSAGSVTNCTVVSDSVSGAGTTGKLIGTISNSVSVSNCFSWLNMSRTGKGGTDGTEVPTKTFWNNMSWWNGLGFGNDTWVMYDDPEYRLPVLIGSKTVIIKSESATFERGADGGVKTEVGNSGIILEGDSSLLGKLATVSPGSKKDANQYDIPEKKVLSIFELDLGSSPSRTPTPLKITLKIDGTGHENLVALHVLGGKPAKIPILEIVETGGDTTITMKSLGASPFIVIEDTGVPYPTEAEVLAEMYRVSDSGGSDDGVVPVATATPAAATTVTTETPAPATTTVTPTATATATVTMTATTAAATTAATEAPVPLAGLLLGLGAAAVLLHRK